MSAATASILTRAQDLHPLIRRNRGQGITRIRPTFQTGDLIFLVRGTNVVREETANGVGARPLRRDTAVLVYKVIETAVDGLSGPLIEYEDAAGNARWVSVNDAWLVSRGHRPTAWRINGPPLSGSRRRPALYEPRCACGARSSGRGTKAAARRWFRDHLQAEATARYGT
jgi:hypothetical protein